MKIILDQYNLKFTTTGRPYLECKANNKLCIHSVDFIVLMYYVYPKFQAIYDRYKFSSLKERKKLIGELLDLFAKHKWMFTSTNEYVKKISYNTKYILK